jgi:hypothetical protein
MAFGTRWLARGRNQDKIGLGHTLLRRRRRLREILQRRVLDNLLLRVGGLLKGGVMSPNLELITFPQAPRRFFVRRPEACNRIKERRNHPRRNSRVTTYDVSRPKFGRTIFPARGGGRLSRGLARMVALSSSPEEGEWAPGSSESSTRSAPVIFLRFVEACDIVGAADADSSRVSTNSRPGYSPPSGWGG